jgi:hypothetical protein
MTDMAPRRSKAEHARAMGVGREGAREGFGAEMSVSWSDKVTSKVGVTAR